jgi:hypothetical protein
MPDNIKYKITKSDRVLLLNKIHNLENEKKRILASGKDLMTRIKMKQRVGESKYRGVCYNLFMNMPKKHPELYKMSTDYFENIATPVKRIEFKVRDLHQKVRGEVPYIPESTGIENEFFTKEKEGNKW